MSSTSSSEPVGYTRIEIESYLPSGWTLGGGNEGTWDAKKGVWKAVLQDGADLEWDLLVRGDDAQKGRIEALRLAMDKLFRERLGRRTRGIGW